MSPIGSKTTVRTGQGTVFAEYAASATTLIHQVSRGLLRAVNNLAVQALVAAYATGKTIVDETSARAAVIEITAD